MGAVVRRLGHPMRALGVYVTFLGGGSVHASRETVSRMMGSSVFRLSGLSTCLTGMESVAQTSCRRAPLRVHAFSLQRAMSGLVQLIGIPAGGGIAVRPRCRVGSALIATSPMRVTGVVDGLVRGTVGCSNGRIQVSLSYVRGRRALAVRVASGKVKVPPTRRDGIFSGFCHNGRVPSQGVPNVKLKLDCMGLLARTRRKRMSLADRLDGKAAFDVMLPRWSFRRSAWSRGGRGAFHE